MGSILEEAGPPEHPEAVVPGEWDVPFWGQGTIPFGKEVQENGDW